MPAHRLAEPKGPINPTPKPPPGSRIVGQLPEPDGRPIYERELEEVVGQKPLVIGGEEQWVQHPRTGAKIRRRMIPVKETRTQRFVLQVERNERGFATGNVTINEHFEPDAKERARIERRERTQQFQEDLAARAVERGITVDELLDRIIAGDGAADPGKGPASSPPGANQDPAGKGPSADPTLEFPLHLNETHGPGKWALSEDHLAAIRAEMEEPFQGKKAQALELIDQGLKFPPG